MIKAVFLSIIFATVWIIPLSASEIGQVELIKRQVHERMDRATWDTLVIKEKVFSDHQIKTSANSAVHIRFVDGSDFRMGGNGKMTIDKYIYDPDKGTGEIAVSLAVGAFRFISGKVHNYKIETTSATIGIRGTDIIVVVLPNGTSLVQVNKGDAAIVPCSKPLTRRFECPVMAWSEIPVGGTAGVTFGSYTVQYGVTVPHDPGLDADGGLASNRTDWSFGNSNSNENLNTCQPSDILCNTIQSPVTTSPFMHVQ